MRIDVKIVKYDLREEKWGKRRTVIYIICITTVTILPQINEKGEKSDMLYKFITSAFVCMTLTQVPKEKKTEIKENINEGFLK